MALELGEWVEGLEEFWVHVRKNHDWFEETLGRNMGIKVLLLRPQTLEGRQSLLLSGKEFGWIVLLCFVEAEHVNERVRYEAGEISKQSIEGMAWFFLR